ncbi:MAG: hypothetical protein NT069_28835 [Planctomycetota bacterium]|nr:hypothetical protein [Planctomycetota bacterium]
MNDDYETRIQSLREWLKSRHESLELKSIATQAMDAFDDLVHDRGDHGVALDRLAAAAGHSRMVVWDLGLSLLARLAEDSEPARDRIWELARSRTAECRRRSVQYLTDGYPREFCVKLLGQLLVDRSAIVREFAAGRCCQLVIREHLPAIASALESEKNLTTRSGMQLSYFLLRDNFFEYENDNGYNIVLNFPEKFPAFWLWPGQVTREQVASVGPEAFRQRTRAELESRGVASGRPWRWSKDREEPGGASP